MVGLSPFVALLLQCAGMAAGTFVCGVIPLYLSLSKTKLRVLEVLGAGLLVGASMTVVLPEGVNALYDTGNGHAHHTDSIGHRSAPEDWAWSRMNRRTVREHVYDPESTVGMSLLAGFLIMFLIDQIASPGAHARSPETSSNSNRDAGSAQWHVPSHRIDAMRLTRASSLAIPKKSERIGEAANENSVPTPNMTDSPDLLPADRDFVTHVQDPLLRHSSGVSRLGGRDLSEGSRSVPDREGSSASSAVRQSRGMRQAFASIAGLIIHAAADGIAMGASAGSGDETLKLVVLFAIMIHKAPASFGLCTLLMGQRLHKIDVRRAVAIFSLATPTGALATYAFLSFLSHNGSGPPGDGTIGSHHIGAALTFSAGTFLFVAMHAVQELASATADVDLEEEHHHRHHHHSHSVSTQHAPTPAPKQILGRTGRIAVLVLGTILPKAMQTFVGHSH